MDEFTELNLGLEDIIEDRLENQKEMVEGMEKELGDMVDGTCESCGRLYYEDYLVPTGNDFKDPLGEVSGSLCIPCWRKKNDLPKLDPDDIK